MRTEELEAKGLDPAAAREEALRQFGDVESVRRQTLEEEDRRRRSVKRAELRDELRQDFVHGLRILRRAPGFAALAAVTLALGIGASTAIFSVVSGVLLQPLPFDRPDELVRIWTRNPARDVRQAPSRCRTSRTGPSRTRTSRAWAPTAPLLGASS